jgi:hypothetical protein
VFYYEDSPYAFAIVLTGASPSLWPSSSRGATHGFPDDVDRYLRSRSTRPEAALRSFGPRLAFGLVPW